MTEQFSDAYGRDVPELLALETNGDLLLRSGKYRFFVSAADRPRLALQALGYPEDTTRGQQAANVATPEDRARHIDEARHCIFAAIANPETSGGSIPSDPTEMLGELLELREQNTTLREVIGSVAQYLAQTVGGTDDRDPNRN